MKKIEFLSLLIFFLALSQIILGLSKVLLQTNLIDFRVYYGAAQDLLRGANPYQQLYSENIPFNYPPSALLFLFPFAITSLKMAQIVWLALSFLSLFATGWIFFKLYLPKREWWLKLLLMAVLFQNFPTKFTLVMGQVNLLVLFLISASFFFYLKKKETPSGLLLGLAAALKISPILLTIFFLARRKFRIVAIALITFIVSNLIFLFLSPDTLFSYFKTVLPNLLQAANQGYYYDQSFLSLMARLGGTGEIWQILNLFFLVGGTGLLLVKFGRLKDSFSELRFFSLSLSLIVMTNAFAWQHHLVFLFPAFLCATFYLLKKKEFLYGLILATAALLVGLHFREPSHPLLANPIIASHGFIGALILGSLIYRLQDKPK